MDKTLLGVIHEKLEDSRYTIESVHTYNDPHKPVLVYRDDELYSGKVQLVIILGYKIDVYYSAYFNFSTSSSLDLMRDKVTFCNPHDDTGTTVERIKTAVTRAKKHIRKKFNFEHYRKYYERRFLAHSYMVGIQETLNNIFDLSAEGQKIQSIYATNVSLNIRSGFGLLMDIRDDKPLTLNIKITATAEQSAVLEDIHRFLDYGASLIEFSYASEESRVTLSMDIEKNYDENLFHLIKNSRLYNQNIANEIGKLVSKS